MNTQCATLTASEGVGGAMLPLAPPPHLFERGGLLHVVDLCVKDDGIAAFVGNGEIISGEIVDVYADYLDRGPTRLALWDLSSARVAKIDGPGVQSLARCLADMGIQRRRRGKTAIECDRDVDFGLARMLAAYLFLEGLAVQVQVFWDSDSARAWLNGAVIDA